MKQIYKFIAGDTLFKEHLESISLLKTEEKDTYHSGQLFVDEVLSGDKELLSFVPKEDDVETLQEKAEEFQSPGVYDKMRGDLVMKTSAQILQLPTMIITPSEAVLYLPFVPDRLTNKEPAFVFMLTRWTKLNKAMKLQIFGHNLKRTVFTLLNKLLFFSFSEGYL